MNIWLEVEASKAFSVSLALVMSSNATIREYNSTVG